MSVERVEPSVAPLDTEMTAEARAHGERVVCAVFAELYPGTSWSVVRPTDDREVGDRG